MNKAPQVFLKHILDSIKTIEEYMGSISQNEFFESKEKQDSAIRRLEIIGEAVKNLPGELKKQHPDTPWQKISGLRDKLIHAYFGIDLELVWEIIKKDLQPLKKQIEEILRDK